jgi:hypothetical protein
MKPQTIKYIVAAAIAREPGIDKSFVSLVLAHWKHDEDTFMQLNRWAQYCRYAHSWAIEDSKLPHRPGNPKDYRHWLRTDYAKGYRTSFRGVARAFTQIRNLDLNMIHQGQP